MLTCFQVEHEQPSQLSEQEIFLSDPTHLVIKDAADLFLQNAKRFLS
jgi:hypothetical protein